MTVLRNIAGWVSRWQEFVVWLPLLVALAFFGYVVLGAFSRLGIDPLAWLAELPVLAAYAAAACGGAWLFKRTNLHDITAAKELELHALAQQGSADARWLLIKDRLEWLVLLIAFFAFFWPAR